MIQERILEIFHFPTVLTRENLTFSEMNVDALSEWVSTLSIMQLGDTAQFVLTALYEISELQCSETLRFDLIQTLHPITESVLASLEKNFLNQGLFHSDRNEHIIELTTRLRIYFTVIYIDIARRSQQQITEQKISFFKFSQKRNLKTARILSTYYAFEQLARLLAQQQMLYSSALSNQWLMTHYLYAMAFRNQEHSININQLQGTNHIVKNIDQAYAQVLLLEILNTHQIRPTEIYSLYQCSYDWAHLVQILPRETSISRYIVDSTKDHPPVYNRKQHESFKPNIYIGTQALLEHINLTIQKDNAYLSNSEKIHLSTSLKLHLQNVLGTSSERRQERFEYSAQLQISFTLQTAHFYLSKAKNLYETVGMDNHLDFQTEATIQSEIASKDHSYLQQQLHVLDRQSKQLYTCAVLDISTQGYRVNWSDQEAPPHLRTGEFILMNETLQNKWKGGVIRWMKQTSHRTYELGLEVLAQVLCPCAVIIGNDRAKNHLNPALIIESLNTDKKTYTLILPNLPTFHEQQGIHLVIAEHDIKVYLLKTILMTQSFIQFDFELLNNEQQTIIDQLIHQQSIESNSHQDLWEALK
ncbi:GTPase [Acinetobacter shaoyimingii]|uniref:GTPase n=1 Tax=Acinetobacter shaoyimingii TaxID=2715164 RepID=A0A6G8RX18_9GAMM|nr:GTPase [Acinetobacter shaoyimingii]NHB56974.1 GTPase [Acinetobacter shaoyimingii]QIO06348.1 GTPase [Acinetobacter shaoyimingii]